MIAESWAELRPMQTQLHGGAGLSGARTACTSAPAPITTSWPEHSWRVTDEAANNHARQRRAIALWVQACPLVGRDAEVTVVRRQTEPIRLGRFEQKATKGTKGGLHLCFLRFLLWICGSSFHGRADFFFVYFARFL